MSVAIINFGYRQLVLPVDKAMQLVDVLVEAEVYEHKYHKDDKTEKTHKTNHIYRPTDNSVEVSVISDEQYQMYKLAGKPE